MKRRCGKKENWGTGTISPKESGFWGGVGRKEKICGEAFLRIWGGNGNKKGGGGAGGLGIQLRKG